MREHLRGREWPEPILTDSGNGFHLLYRIELPADDGSMVQQMLRALAARFDSDHVSIDQTVFNPSRICKCLAHGVAKGITRRSGRTALPASWRRPLHEYIRTLDRPRHLLEALAQEGAPPPSPCRK